MIVPPWALMKCHMLRCRRDGRFVSLVSTGTLAMVSPIFPAWMIVSKV